MRNWTIVCSLLLGWLASVATSTAPSKPNVLLIIGDDFRPEGRLGIDEHPGGPGFSTPNINKLARESMVFDAAFAQSPSCGPSRASLLTGFNVDRLKYWSFVSAHWRASGTAWLSLPEYFRKVGYTTVALGKIFHYDDIYRDDAEHSWDRTIYTFPYSGGETKCLGSTDFFCPCDRAWGCVDSNLADQAIMQINTLCNQNKPWFLALGFRRPHMDWNLPENWMREKELENATVPMPVNREMHPSIPNQAFYACLPLLAVPGENTLPQGASFSDPFTASIRRYYWASVKYMDEQLGRVITFFESRFPREYEKTIVVFMSDHGWSLGERGLWCKQNLFDDANRVAMMFRVPWKSTAGKRETRPVSLVDIFPTLVDLTGIPPPLVSPCFGGKALFAGPVTDDGVISLFPRCTAAKGANPFSNPCMNERPSQFRVMGYSLRTRDYRYTEWRTWLGAEADWSSSGLVAAELYDHTGNSMSPAHATKFEVLNVAQDSAYSGIRASLASQLKNRITDPNWASRCTLTDSPTSRPSRAPSVSRPTASPTRATASPTQRPTRAPTNKPTTRSPTTPEPTTLSPTTKATTASPTTRSPTTVSPTTSAPTPKTTSSPTTGSPTTRSPTIRVTDSPTKEPTVPPSQPTKAPTSATKSPTTKQPTSKPTMAPTSGSALPLKSQDLAAFQRLYDATGGSDWVSCRQSREDPCNVDANGCDLIHHFIVCEIVNQELRLVEVTLPNNRMVGQLPDTLLQLPELKVVNLANDQSREQDPNANAFSNVPCIQAPRCFAPGVSCAFSNSGTKLCDAVIPVQQCPSLSREQCTMAKSVCQFYQGGYGCQSKTFCGFLTRNYIAGNPPPALASKGITRGAQGCLGRVNIKRCRWVQGKCVPRKGGVRRVVVKKRRRVRTSRG